MTEPDHEPRTGLAPEQVATYFALTEAVGALQHHVEQHLRAEIGLSAIQFRILATLAESGGRLTMTELADGVVYSRSGLTYQAGLLEKAGLVTRRPSPDDERSTLLAVTDEGLARVEQAMPGHVEVVKRLLFDSLSDADLAALGDVMTRVRDHMRAQPPRSAAPRKRRSALEAR
jgi:DNA-binding MarR family transcriptional regulator